MERRYKEL